MSDNRRCTLACEAFKPADLCRPQLVAAAAGQVSEGDAASFRTAPYCRHVLKSSEKFRDHLLND